MLGECVPDCNTDPAVVPATTTSVPGFHEVGGKCTADVVPDPKPTSNNDCTPVKAGWSVDKVT